MSASTRSSRASAGSRPVTAATCVPGRRFLNSAATYSAVAM
jgi:hypothetical protein